MRLRRRPAGLAYSASRSDEGRLLVTASLLTIALHRIAARAQRIRPSGSESKTGNHARLLAQWVLDRTDDEHGAKTGRNLPHFLDLALCRLNNGKA